MKQMKNERGFTNAWIGPWFASMPETYQTLTDVKDSLVTNVAIIKDYVRSHKHQFRNSILDEYR